MKSAYLYVRVSTMNGGKKVILNENYEGKLEKIKLSSGVNLLFEFILP